MPKYVIGVDIGGTKILAGLVNPQGKVVKNMQMATDAHKGKDAVLANLISCIQEVFEDGVSAIGVGVPAPVDKKKGIVEITRNIPDWKNVNLVKILKSVFNVPVFIENDANCFCLAEQKYGFGKNVRNFVGVTIGTGLGCGIILEGKLFEGNTGAAGEIGMVPYRGITLEDYAAGPALKRISKYQGKPMSILKLTDMAKKNKLFARQVFTEYGYNIGVTLSIISNLLDPEMIIIGGSVSRSFNLFKDTMMETLQKSVFPATFKKLKVRKSNLKDAGILGAALIASKK